MSAVTSGLLQFGAAYYKASNVAPPGTYDLAKCFNAPCLVTQIVGRQLVAGAGFTSIQLVTSGGQVLTAVLPLSDFTLGANIPFNVSTFILHVGETIQAILAGTGTAGETELFIVYADPTSATTLN